MKLLDEEHLKRVIEERIHNDIKNERIGGVAVAVMQKKEVLFQKYFGSNRLGITVDKGTLFRLASMTKPITAIAVLILVDRKLIKLEDNVSKYIPEYKEMNVGYVDENKNIKILRPAQREITIRHLLTHSSGLGSDEVGGIEREKMSPEVKKNLKTSVEYYSNTALAFEPGDKAMYSGVFAFDVLARIVELVSGVPYDEFLEKEIFIPLGMTNTTFSPTVQQWDKLIPMHDVKNEKGITISMPSGCIFADFPVTHFCGGAGLVSNLEDYLKFARMLLQGGIFEGRQVVSKEMLAAMCTPYISDDIRYWGLGVRVIREGDDANLPAGTYGWSGAYGTHFWIDPQNEIIAIYLKNSLYDGGSEALTSKNFEYDVYR